MKIAYNWLKEYLKIEWLPEDVAMLLTDIGLEVESIDRFESVPGSLKDIVVGKILEVQQHPNADKLKVTKVDVGTEQLDIVCGAPNVAEGQFVIVALVGSTIYPINHDPVKIKKAKIRGEASFGMICAEDEIGIGHSHDGIIVLNDSWAPGTPAAEVFEIAEDVVFDIGLTPNRSDANSHIGTARDLCAGINVQFDKSLQLDLPSTDELDLAGDCPVKVSVESAEACPRYSGLLLENVKVGESPDWLKNRLLSVGVRPINNVVDITNFVLHEYGQPLHAFDADKINGRHVIVKSLDEGSTFVTLDGEERKLSHEDLMICDEKGGMCIAGVFGGQNSGVTETTQSVFLESAYFAPTQIRKTSFRHGLRTDAAMHYEKGCDPEITIAALKRAAALLMEYAGAQPNGGIVDVRAKEQPQNQVKLKFDYLANLIGIEIEPKKLRRIFDQLEMKAIASDTGSVTLEIPSYRTEVTRPADVAEDVLRIYGYNNIPLPDQLTSALQSTKTVDHEKIDLNIANFLAGAGFNEITTNSISKSSYYSDSEKLIRLSNSQTAELDILRGNLLYSALEVVAHNVNRKQADLRLFELGRIYQKGGSQQRQLVLIATGKSEMEYWSSNKRDDFNLFDLKGETVRLLQRLGHANFSESEGEYPSLNEVVHLNEDDHPIASIGAISKEVLDTFGIQQGVFAAIVDIDRVYEQAYFQQVKYTPIAKYPSVRRDLAMVLETNVPFESIKTLSYQTAKPLLRDVNLFDVYTGDKIDTGKKSYAVGFTFQDDHKTLTDKAVDKIMAKLRGEFESQLNAVIRE